MNFRKTLANSKSCCDLISSLLISFFRNRGVWVGNRNDTICKCGLNDSNMTQFSYEDKRWCCKTTSEECTLTTTQYYDRAIEVKCIGIPLNLTQQCHHNDNDSPGCNYYPMDIHRNFEAARSYVDICQDNK